jgi:hypothetical protein
MGWAGGGVPEAEGDDIAEDEGLGKSASIRSGICGELM